MYINRIGFWHFLVINLLDFETRKSDRKYGRKWSAGKNDFILQ